MRSNKLTIWLVAFAAILFTVSASSAQKVRYNFLPGTDFSKYKTYRWVRVEKAEYPSQLVDEQIKRSIDAQMSAKGFRRIETGEPDLIAVYQTAVNRETQWNTYDMGGPWGWGGWYGWGGYGGGMSTTTSSTIHVGTLNLDFYDTGLKKQVWRGAATKTLNPPKDPAKLQSRIDKAMKKLLKNFPPNRK